MLRVERDGGILRWTIDRPAVKNALDHATMIAIADAVKDVAHDRSIRVAILTGAGDAFVSGGDLRALRERTSEADGLMVTTTGFAMCRGLAELPFPVIAAIRGVAIGGGAELAMACDIRIADATAMISFKQTRLGVTTSWGTVPRLVALVGAGQAARLLYSAREIRAEEARDIGLVDKLSSKNAIDAATALANEIVKGAPGAVRNMKRLVRASVEAEHDLHSLEEQLFIEGWTSDDHIEAVEAFFAKRAPVWRSS